MVSSNAECSRNIHSVLTCIRSLHLAILAAEPYEAPKQPGSARSSNFVSRTGSHVTGQRHTPSLSMDSIEQLAENARTAVPSTPTASVPTRYHPHHTHTTPTPHPHHTHTTPTPHHTHTTPTPHPHHAHTTPSHRVYRHTSPPRGVPPPAAYPDLVQDPDSSYVIEVIEQAGQDIILAAYWDVGEWSDLWKEHKHVPEETLLEKLFYAKDELSKTRLCRLLLELMRTAASMCPGATAVTQHEIYTRLNRMVTKDTSGPKLLVNLEYLEGRRLEAWRCCASAALACPPLRDRLQPPPAAAAGHLAAGMRASASLSSSRNAGSSSSAAQHLSSKDVIALLVGRLDGPPGSLQACSVLALGHMSPEYYDDLLLELKVPMEEYSKGVAPSRVLWGSAKSRPEDMRRSVAHVFRIIAYDVPPEKLATNGKLRTRLLEWVRETYLYLRPMSLSSEAFWEVSQVAYCLACVVRHVAGTLGPALQQEGNVRSRDGAQFGRDPPARIMETAFSTQTRASIETAMAAPPAAAPLRKLLYDMFMSWTEEGYMSMSDVKATFTEPKDREARETMYARSVANGMYTAIAKHKEKEADSLDQYRSELHQTAHNLDCNARLAMAALLAGPAFDASTRSMSGLVLEWVDKLLCARPDRKSSLPIPRGLSPVSTTPRGGIARTALLALLTHNLDMFLGCIDKCYDPDPVVATGYFQVLSEVYCSAQPQSCKVHVMLCLVMNKMVDPQQEVRESALHMLSVLRNREWNESTPLEPGQSMRSVPDTLQSASQRRRADSSPGDQRSATSDPGYAPSTGGSGTAVLVVVAHVQDAYHRFQYMISSALAREHLELSEQICEEMMTRQLNCVDGVTPHPMLTSLAPWMENLTILTSWPATWCERLLKSMYYVTLTHGRNFPCEIEQIWSTLARNKRNITPILDFLVTLGMSNVQQNRETIDEFFSVGKRLALYLARVSPQPTIHHLVYEVGQQLMEEDTLMDGCLGGGGMDPPLEFQGLTRSLSVSAGGRGGLLLGPKSSSEGTSSVMAAGEAARSLELVRRQHSGRSASSSASSSSTPHSGADSAPHSAGQLVHKTPSRSSSRADEWTGHSGGGGKEGGGVGGVGGVGGGGSQQMLSSGAPIILSDRWRGPSSAGGNGGGSGGALRQHSRSQHSRSILTRPELALCLLTEIAYEHDDDFRNHIPLLLHIAIICVDNDEALVTQHCQLLIINLMFCLSARYLQKFGAEGLPVECSLLSNLIRYLQSMKGRRLWSLEEQALSSASQPASAIALAGLVSSIAEAMQFEEGLQDQWAHIALEWALHARSRHLASRSLQTFRALQPALSADICATLLLCLHQCCVATCPAAAEVGVEVVGTLRHLITSLPPGRMVVYPQVGAARALDMLRTRKLGTERDHRRVEHALEATNRARTLVQRLLAFARRQPLAMTSVDIAQLVDGMASLLTSTLGPDIRLVLTIDANLPAVIADANQLEMAILNLGVNARDAMPDGGILTVSASTERVGKRHRSALAPGAFVRFCVADTGSGMDEETRARAIEPFFSTKAVGKGTGLGLSMVHGLASQFGGAMTILTAPNAGTQIEMWLPISKKPAVAKKTATGVSRLRAAPGTVALLVDDDELVRTSTADMLDELGYAVIQAASADEALNRLAEGTPIDALITDHVMVGMSGTELARIVLSTHVGINVLVVSGYADAAAFAPEIPHLTKPFFIDDLAAMLLDPQPLTAVVEPRPD
ncbi:MAG: hypothetical protein WDW36_002975 [Sanguina aurantia]